MERAVQGIRGEARYPGVKVDDPGKIFNSDV